MSDERNTAGYVFSGALHAGLLASVIFGFAAAPKFDDTHESIPVETISQSQFNQVMKGEPDAPAPKPAPKDELKPTLAAAEPVPAPPARPEAPPPPPPKPEPPKPEPTAPAPPVRPKPVEAPTSPPTPKPTPSPKPSPKVDALAKLIDAQTPSPAPSPTHSFDPTKIMRSLAVAKPTPEPTATVASAAPLGLPQHNSAKMSLSMKVELDSWFQDAYRSCWSPPPTPPGDKYIAQIRVEFDDHGKLIGQPRLANPPSDPAWQAYADSAIRAVQKCDPLQIPPRYAPFYDEWRTKLIHFDPDTELG